MKISVIIVNYNVKFFLEQCLLSVQRAIKGMEAEVFVVDNNSVDGSVPMLAEKFPSVTRIVNKENAGFARANNQAIRRAAGQYVLLLNPDTLLEDDTLSKAVAFMDNHPEAGGLGARMVDGKGNFLKESKRGLPTPAVAFYKISGLSALFPRSKVFARYHLGHLDPSETHEVDVLAGAFMMLRRKAVEKTGLLDEAFFMYGEDIDLSCRLTKAGYRNYYFPDARIIHYKGESTKKSSINYVLVFYKAMIIFARKHFSEKSAALFTALINAAIYLRATVAILSRLARQLALPAADALLLYAGLLLIAAGWERFVRFPDGGSYPPLFTQVILPAYTAAWLLSIYVAGGYRKPFRLAAVTRGLLAGTAVILTVYALLDKSLQFSRAIILLGAAWGILSLNASRMAGHYFRYGTFDTGRGRRKKVVVVGGAAETARVKNLLENVSGTTEVIGSVSPETADGKLPEGALGSLHQLREIAIIYRPDEIIFCSGDVPAHTIIDLMASPGNLDADFKIAPPGSFFIIGSRSIEGPLPVLRQPAGWYSKIMTYFCR